MKILNLYLALTSLLVDAIAVFAGMLVAYALRTHGGELFNWPFNTYVQRAALVVPVWLLLFASQGLYNARTLPRGWNGLGRLLIGLVGGWGIVFIILYFWRSPEATTLSRLLIAYAVAFTTLFLVAARLIIGQVVNSLYRSGTGALKTVIINGEHASNFARQLARDWHHGHKVIGEFPAENALDQLEQLSKTEKIEEIIIDRPALSEETQLAILNWAELHGANFGTVPSLLSVRATNVETVTLAGTPVMYFLRTPLEGWRRIFKRLLDLIIVIPALIILSPVMLILYVGSQLATGSGIIKQERVGQDGRVFTIHKFRSMYVDWQKRFPEVRDWSANEATDPRITAFGRFIRKTNLDELAQLWDIFRGAMSIVGPRPEQPKYVHEFSQAVPDYLRRHHVKSGLTGWAQINGLRGNTSISERVKYDLFYIEHWSIWFDIRIILATFIYIFRQAFGGRNSA